ncbi:MAG TPA: SpoIIE family protein phosphatase [Thermoanaerobaculia bacterium]|jgi:serine phosphatase RsbU (regulator of sigma subunit)|nr:SpoIIE family protein phosphatase [Thermoanaerobaculia bacterium]
MKIRAQLVLACFLLSVLPLSVIVVYSYQSSRNALELASRREADARTRQMDRRLATIRGDLQQRLAEVSALPAPGAGGDRTPNVGNILMTMGDAASLVDSLEIHPMRMVMPEVRTIVRKELSHVPSTSRNSPPGVEEPPPAPMPPQVAELDDESDPSADADSGAAPKTVVAGVPPAPKLPKFTMTPEQRDAINEIAMLSIKLGQGWQTLSPEERTATEKRIQDRQKQLTESLKQAQSQWSARFDAAQKQRDEYFHARRQQREAAAARVHAHEGERHPPVPPAIAPHAAPQVAAAPEAAAAPATTSAAEATTSERKVIDPEPHRIKANDVVFGQRFNVPLRNAGTIIGHISAQVSTPEVVRRVLGARVDDSDEITFAVDHDNNLYTRTPDDRKTLDSAGISDRVLSNRPVNDVKDWIVVTSVDPQSGLRVGVARPVGDNLEELRKTAARNFGYGMGLIFVALIGIVPIANHMTRDVNLVTRGAERIAQGDLMTRLPVKSNNEIGKLAAAFNRMAQDLSLQQQTIVEQERTRKEQEIQQRILALEYERKSVDLEEARRFQLSMLPKSVPAHDRYDVAVFTLTAAEVGGDYYDFHVAPNGVLSVTIGDATGHGAKAGTMVTVIKALFAGYTPDVMPAQFLRDAAEKVKRMDLGRMAMALLLARFERDWLTVASAGMLPGYVHRPGSGRIEEVARGATPLGTLGADYHDVAIDLAPGDTVLFMTDGFPELQNESGQQLGYAVAVDEFAAAAGGATAADVIASLAATARRWNGERPPNDDVTFVVVRAKPA